VDTGERVGLIKFGSRVYVLLGPEWEIAVQPGMHVSAGSSIIARKVGHALACQSETETARRPGVPHGS